MSERTRRRATRAMGLLGLAAGLMLLPLDHGARADHTSRLTLQAVQDHVDDLEAAVTALPAATCGDGIATFDEECDGAHLRGATCQTQGFLHGALACDGSCVLDTSGCSNYRFEDTGLTVIDHATGLEWEKKTDANVNVGYRYGAWIHPDGNAFWLFLGGLNYSESSDGTTVTPGFAGYADWRLPQIDELQTILDCSFGSPCIDPIFGPTASSSWPLGYWSATSFRDCPGCAWYVNFGSGGVFNDLEHGQEINRHVRAVRGGP